MMFLVPTSALEAVDLKKLTLKFENAAPIAEYRLAGRTVDLITRVVPIDICLRNRQSTDAGEDK